MRIATYLRQAAAFLFTSVMAVQGLSAAPAVGSIDGSFATTPDGAATYVIPLKVPPGTSGLQPQLSLSYNSRGGKSPFGYGWNITGLSLIQRGVLNLEDDGVVRGVKFDANDNLLLDGEKLVPVVDNRTASDPAHRYVEYRSRVDNRTRVRAYGWTSTGPASFVADTKTGLRLTFGSTENSRVNIKAGAGPTVIWLCDQIEDRFSNYMELRYVAQKATNDYQILEIAYAGNRSKGTRPYAKLTFEYEDLAKAYELRMLEGTPSSSRKRLKKIQSTYQGEVLRTYTPKFATHEGLPDSQFFLDELIESGVSPASEANRTKQATLAYPATRFTYTHSVPLWAQRPWLGSELADLPDLGRISEGFVPVTVVKDGKKRTAVVYRLKLAGKEIAGSFFYDDSNSKWAKLEGSQGLIYVPPVPTSDLSGRNQRVAWTDLNGDGFTDLIVTGHSAAEDGTYVASEGGWSRAASFPVPISGGSLEGSGVLSMSRGAGQAPLLIWGGGAAGGAASLNGSTWSPFPLKPPQAISDSTGALGLVYAVDVDCDGIAELVYGSSAAGVSVHKVIGGKWDPLPSDFHPPVKNLPARHAFQDLGPDAQGCARVLTAYQAGTQPVRTAKVASATGWQSVAAPPEVLFVRRLANTTRIVASVVDIDGDDNKDILAHTRNGEERYAYLWKNGAWVASQRFAPPNPLPAELARREGAFQVLSLPRPDGSARTALMLVGRQSQVALPKFYLQGAGGGWEPSGSYALPAEVNIAAFDKLDLGVRFLDANGDGYPDIVIAVRRGATLDSKAWLFKPNAPGSKWVSDPTFALPEPLATEDYKDTGVVLSDVNGDGLVDILTATEKTVIKPGLIVEKKLEAAVYINCSKMAPFCTHAGGVWQKDIIAALVPPKAFIREGFGGLGVRAIDINGDGLTDLVISNLLTREPDPPNGQGQRNDMRSPGAKEAQAASGQGKTKQEEEDQPPPSPYTLVSTVYLNQNGTSWREAPEVALPIPLVRQIHCPRSPGFNFGMNQPAEPEECQYFRDDEINSGVQTLDTGVQLLDVNADRLPDFVYHYRTFKQEFKDGKWRIVEGVERGAYLNTGKGWVAAPLFSPPSRIDPDTSIFTQNGTQLFFDDLNGDGYPDLTYLLKGGSKVYLGTGVGWGAENAWYSIPDEAVAGGRGDLGVRFLDIEGDGLVDLVYNRAGGAWAGSGVYVNTGTGWKKAAPQLVPPIPFTEEGIADAGVRPLDVNGDGFLDIIQFFSRQGGTTDRSVWINESGKPGLLREVATGLDFHVEITYQSYMSYSENVFPARSDQLNGCGEVGSTCASQYPVIHALLPGFVATRVETFGNGVERRTRSYTYAGYRVNTMSGRSLGFQFQDLVDEQRRQVTRTQYDQRAGILGTVVSSSTKRTTTSTNLALSESSLTWTVISTLGLAHPEANGVPPKIYRSQLKSQTSITRDLHGAVLSEQTDSYEYDSRGYIKVAVSTYAGGQRETVRTEYDADDLVSWTLSRPNEISREYAATGWPTLNVKGGMTYYRNSYSIETETHLAGTRVEKRVTYGFDAFGNRESTTTRVEDKTRVQKTPYDSQGRFMRAIENALGHTISIDYEQKSGVVTGRTNVNGGTTRVEFDALQSATKEKTSTGLETHYSTRYVNSIEGVLFISEKRAGSLPPELTFGDALGRTRRKVAFVFTDGSTSPCPWLSSVQAHSSLTPVYSTFGYDSLGRQNSSTVPTKCGEVAGASKTTVYDALDRPTKITNPDGTTQKLKYVGLETKTINALNQTTTVLRDIRGRNREVVDTAGGTILLRYDSRGRLASTTDALGRATVFGYDEANNRTSVKDPIGTWVLGYNGFGELVSQTDPKGNEVVLRYDELGRLRTRKAGSREYSWVFDACRNGTSRLCSVVGVSGDTRAYSYDAVGRVESVLVGVGHDSVLISPSYDPDGRITQKEYSTGAVVKNGYNRAGQLNRVSLTVDGNESVLLEVREFDEVGRPRHEVFGNLNRKTDYKPLTNRVDSIKVQTNQGEALQSFGLTYDAIGNVKKRWDGAAGWSETIGYDSLNRIVTVQGEGEREVSAGYDAIGNILGKSDVGTYHYCGPALNQRLCSVDGEKKFGIAYDAGGNITQLGELRLKFDHEGKVESIEQGGEALRTSYSEFSYNADGQLITHESRQTAIKSKLTLLDEIEIVRESFAPPVFSTPERTRIRLNIAGPSGMIGFHETTLFHHPYQMASPLYANTIRLGKERVTHRQGSFHYLLKDHLATAVAVVDARGKVSERFRFDPWGKRRAMGSDSKYTNQSLGFTGHRQIDAFDLVHMGGRVYSAIIGRFMSPDVMTQLGLNTQSYNRYAYVLNNPLKLVDPSGFDIFGDVWDAVSGAVSGAVRWVGDQLDKAGRWVGANWKIIVIVVVAIAAPYAVGLLWTGLNAIAIGAITGAAVGATSGALYGGTINDVIQGAAMGAITGAIMGSVAYAYGDAYSVSRVVAEGAAGGAAAHIRGGNFSQGFWFSAAMAAATYANQEMRRKEIENSAQRDAWGEDNLEPSDSLSKGKFGDRYKLAGTRKPERLLSMDGNPPCVPGFTGGCQSQPGTLGSWHYDKGSWADNLLESYAGPHDWMSGPMTYNSTGFQAADKLGQVKYLGDAASGIMIVPATYFAIPAFVPIQVREEMRQRCSNAYGWCIY